MSLPYQLAPSAFVCQLQRAFIILDTARGRYYRIAGTQHDWFCEIVSSAAADSLSDKAAAYAGRLAALGLITQKECGKSVSGPSSARPAARPLMAPSRSARLADIARVGVAHWISARFRRSAGLAEVLAAAGDWKRHAAGHGIRKRSSLEIEARVFEDISPLFLSRHDACFAHSLALLCFLTRRGHCVDWNFGVQDAPFRAHCWIESGDGTVLNDDPDHVSGYCLIMSV